MKWGAFRALLSILALNAPPAQSTGSRSWTTSRKIASREATRQLWHHGFDSYMHHAFPLDELSPVSCTGQGPDWGDPSAIHFNDVNANISLTLIDNLDSFIVLSNRTGFEHAIQQVLSHVSFDVDTKPQVFEVTIRALGGLLSAHLFASSEQCGFRIDGYTDALLVLARDLGERLLPAFATPTGIPYARINLRRGVQQGESLETCTAGAGSLLLEFATLSRWTGDPRFETAARRAFFAVWNRRSKIGLVGNSINLRTGAWIEPLVSGVGAGIDSFYEYALKMYVLTGEQAYLNVWNDAYESIIKHSRGPDGFWYRTVGILTGEVAFQHIDSLGAFWPGLQVLAGDIENAIKGHLVYWGLWKRYSGIPETFNIFTRQAISLGYPLRPEFIESTYFLYRATQDSFYLDVGERILEDLTRRAKVSCGLSTISNLLTSTREDRMESFALSESLKYLYLLFDEENVLNRDTSNFVFTTEGHILAVQAYSEPASTKRHPDKSRRHQNSTMMASGANSPLHSTVQGDGYRGQLVCPFYVGPRVGASSTLRGSIRDRPDFEYARLLSGISVSTERALGMGFPAAKDTKRNNESLLWPTPTSESTTKKEPAVATAADREWWDPNGWCEAPQAEEYVLEWIISGDGSLVLEDQAPSSSKVSAIPGGFVIYNITGLRLRAMARIDHSGYDVIRIGPYPVRPGQKVIVKDPAVSASNPNALGDAGNTRRRKFAPDIYLRISLPTRDDIAEIPDSYDFPLYKENTESGTTMGIMLDIVAATATFGGNPAVPRVIATPGSDYANASPKAPLIFGPESPYNGAIRVLRSEEHNLDGCEDHHPGLRYGHTISPQEFFSSAGSTLQDSAHTLNAPEASVVFVKRGGCTFLRKLVAAKNAGFNGVIVWNSQDEASESSNLGGLVTPSIDEHDKGYAERELNDVAIVVIGREDGTALDAMTRLAQSKNTAQGENTGVVVEVFVDSPPLLAGDQGDGLEPVAPEEPFPAEDIEDDAHAEAMRPSPRILHINGLALRNTIVV